MPTVLAVGCLKLNVAVAKLCYSIVAVRGVGKPKSESRDMLLCSYASGCKYLDQSLPGFCPAVHVYISGANAR